MVLSDKPAFVRTPNHQSEKTLISIFKTLLSSGFYTLLRCPLSTSNSGAHDPVKSVKWCLSYSKVSCLLDPLCHIQSQVLHYPFSVLLPDSVKHIEAMVKQHPIKYFDGKIFAHELLSSLNVFACVGLVWLVRLSASMVAQTAGTLWSSSHN